MSRQYRAGLFTGIIIYALGVALSYILQLVLPPGGNPPNSVLPIYLLIAVGFVRLIMSMSAWFVQNSPRAKGEFTAHVIGVIVVFILLAYASDLNS